MGKARDENARQVLKSGEYLSIRRDYDEELQGLAEKI